MKTRSILRICAAACIISAIPKVQAGTVTWTGLGDGVWSGSSDNDFSPAYNDGDDAVFNSGGTITVIGSGVAPASVRHDSSANGDFTGGFIGGTGVFTKAGSSYLTLSSANTYSGGTVIEGGWLVVEIGDAAWGSPAGNVTLNGGGWRGNDWTTSRDIIVTPTGGRLLTYGNGDVHVNGKLTGTGPLTFADRGGAGGRNFTFKNTGNDFTGPIIFEKASSYKVEFYSLLDSTNGISFTSSGSGACTFRWGSGAIGPLVLTSRNITFASTTSRIITFDNDNTSYGITFGADMRVTSTYNQTVTLDAAVAGPTNEISGAIPDGEGGATMSITKVGSGTWKLSGQNTYTGPTTLNGGTLAVDGRAALPDTGSLNIISGKLHLDDIEAVGALLYNGVPQPAGRYGSTSTVAENRDDTRFSGTEILYVGIGLPPAGTVIVLK